MDNKIATLSDLRVISEKDTGEPLINLDQIKSNICVCYRRMDTALNAILVRKSVADKLKSAQKRLERYDATIQLMVVEGYRPLAYQERYFTQELLNQSQKHPFLDFNHLLELTHQFVAHPSVAGHPTGGAVDLTLAHAGEELDLGGGIADFSFPKILPTYSRLITPEQSKRRILLHDVMLAEGFAPFYGEWWHFSFGDREWAAFYGKKEAIFSPFA